MKKKRLSKIMGLVLAAALFFAVNADAAGKGQANQPVLKASKAAKFTQPRTPATVELFVPHREQMAGLGPQPEPPDLPSAFRNPMHLAGLGPQPEPPDLPTAFENPMHVTKISPQPEPPTLPAAATSPAMAGGVDPEPDPPDDPRAGTPMPIPPSSPTAEMNPATRAGINPQPEPPRPGYFMARYLQMHGQGQALGATHENVAP